MQLCIWNVQRFGCVIPFVSQTGLYCFEHRVGQISSYVIYQISSLHALAHLQSKDRRNDVTGSNVDENSLLELTGLLLAVPHGHQAYALVGLIGVIAHRNEDLLFLGKLGAKVALARGS